MAESHFTGEHSAQGVSNTPTPAIYGRRIPLWPDPATAIQSRPTLPVRHGRTRPAAVNHASPKLIRRALRALEIVPASAALALQSQVSRPTCRAEAEIGNLAIALMRRPPAL